MTLQVIEKSCGSPAGNLIRGQTHGMCKTVPRGGLGPFTSENAL